MKLSVSQAHGWIYSQFVSSATRKKWRVETVALLFSQEICIATSPRRLFCTFGQCVLLAIFLAVRSRSVRRVGSWKMTSWLLCVILLMRMSSRSRRVHRHCGAAAAGPTNWTIVNRSMKTLLSWLVTELLYLPNRRILLEYGTLLKKCLGCSYCNISYTRALWNKILYLERLYIVFGSSRLFIGPGLLKLTRPHFCNIL